MRDRLRAVECPKEIIDQIGGWSSSDVGESYGVGFQLNNLNRWLGYISTTHKYYKLSILEVVLKWYWVEPIMS